jgi:hypothetical protein
MKKPSTKKEAYEAFIGSRAVEEDESWSQEVWNAAWEAAFNAVDKYSEDHDREWREYALEVIEELQ